MFRWMTKVSLMLAAVVGTPSAGLGAQQRLQNPSRERPKEPASDAPHDQQGGDLASAAAAVREAWLAHDAGKIVANSAQLMIQLPGADPSAPLGAKQAAATLSDFLAAAQEVELKVRAQGVNAERGYVELVRHYRINGTQDVRAQSLYLGYRRSPRGWVLTELRVVSEP